MDDKGSPSTTKAATGTGIPTSELFGDTLEPLDHPSEVLGHTERNWIHFWLNAVFLPLVRLDSDQFKITSDYCGLLVNLIAFPDRVIMEVFM